MRNNIRLLYAIILMVIISLSIGCDSKKVKHRNRITEMVFCTQIYYGCENDSRLLNNKRLLRLLDEKTMTDKPVLVTWVSALGCSCCVENTMTLVKKVSEINNELSIIRVGADYHNANGPFEFDFLLEKNETLGIPAEELKQPFFFIYFNKEVRHLFFPELGYDKIFDYYIHAIVARYCCEND